MTPAARAQLDREQCRKAVRAYLAERPQTSLSVGAITRGLRNEGGYSEDEVTAALAFLVSQKHVQKDPDSDGATLYFQITAEGILAYERS